MDLLSDVLHSMRLRGRLHFSDSLTSPWHLQLAASDHILKLHFVVSGACRIDVGHGEQDFAAGALAVVPSHVDHAIRSIDSIPETRLVCGEFVYDGNLRHPLFDHLPAILVQGCEDCSDSVWLQQAMQLLAIEIQQGQPGQSALVERLLEIILIQALRHFIDQGGQGARFLAGMNDRALVKALIAMHENPAQNWTVESLAHKAALSRTAFATRFQSVMGEPPMQYLTHWRMLTAGRLLQQPGVAMTDIALQVGYQSEAAFGKVFKRVIGVTPGRYRKERSEKPAFP